MATAYGHGRVHTASPDEPTVNLRQRTYAQLTSPAFTVDTLGSWGCAVSAAPVGATTSPLKSGPTTSRRAPVAEGSSSIWAPGMAEASTRAAASLSLPYLTTVCLTVSRALSVLTTWKPKPLSLLVVWVAMPLVLLPPLRTCSLMVFGSTCSLGGGALVGVWPVLGAGASPGSGGSLRMTRNS